MSGLADGFRSGTPATLQSLLHAATERLRGAECEAPSRTARWMLEDLLDVPRTAFLLEPERLVSDEHVRQFAQWVQRRASGEPLQHILGYATFRGLRIRVSPDVLIPRPETEEVVAHALGCIADVDAPRVLDVGTGSGCIALALKDARPDATMAGCDVSRAALRVARANGEHLNLDVAWHTADVLDDAFPALTPGALDLLVSNPPYIPDAEAHSLPDVVHDYDPHVALFSGTDPLRFYHALARHAKDVLAPSGWLVVEAHADYATGVANCFRTHGLDAVDVVRDFAGRPRIAQGSRIEQPH